MTGLTARQALLARVFACALLLAALAGCASFERKWKGAKHSPTSQDEFAGRWEGWWKSVKHPDHGGRLRCIFTKLDGQHYRGDFRANWFVAASSYTATFQTKRAPGGRLRLAGEENLGWLFGGVYRYDGFVSPTHFYAAYSSRYDDGAFEMRRAER